MQYRMKHILVGMILTIALIGCANYDFSRRVVQQGNLLPQSLVERLKPGMSKEDAATLLGTSLLSPTFNESRWDYAYTWRKGNGAMQIKTVSIYFSHGQISRLEHKP